MNPGRQIGGAAIIGGRRRRRLVLTPRPTVCEACRTDTEVGVCPADCPTRGQTGRGRM